MTTCVHLYPVSLEIMGNIQAAQGQLNMYPQELGMAPELGGRLHRRCAPQEEREGPEVYVCPAH